MSLKFFILFHSLLPWGRLGWKMVAMILFLRVKLLEKTLIFVTWLDLANRTRANNVRRDLRHAWHRPVLSCCSWELYSHQLVNEPRLTWAGWWEARGQVNFTASADTHPSLRHVREAVPGHLVPAEPAQTRRILPTASTQLITKTVQKHTFTVCKPLSFVAVRCAVKTDTKRFILING